MNSLPPESIQTLLTVAAHPLQHSQLRSSQPQEDLKQVNVDNARLFRTKERFIFISIAVGLNPFALSLTLSCIFIGSFAEIMRHPFAVLRPVGLCAACFILFLRNVI
jgi:hypothetical protein